MWREQLVENLTFATVVFCVWSLAIGFVMARLGHRVEKQEEQEEERARRSGPGYPVE